jgi:aldose 1-epimerase
MAFKVEVIGEGIETKVELTDTSSNTIVEVYAFGALLNKFLFEHGDLTLNVIDGYESPAEAVRDITPLFKSAKLSPFVCRVKDATYHFGEKNYTLHKSYSGSSAIHGLLYDHTFDVIHTAQKHDHASATLQYKYESLYNGFPFNYTCEVTYKLEKDNALNITSTIINDDDKLLPITDGWHPYFTLGIPVNDCQLEFQSKEILEFDDALIPTGNAFSYQEFSSLKTLGNTSFDNCFTANFAECQPMCVFRNPKEKFQVEIHPDPSYPYLQIFTPDHRRSIAIENLSAAPDAFNNGMGLLVLEPGKTAIFSTTYKLRSL